MATEAPTIDPAPPPEIGLDYARLKEEGIALIQQLAGDVWTDYNEHDPGVTTLEQLCYALTELSYRADLPLADLLARQRSGRIAPRRQALYPARQILPCSPVTENDYRRLIVDRVSGVANAWLIPRHPPAAGEVDGLYDVAVYLSGPGSCRAERGASGDVQDRVWRVYARHRSLCEDLHAVVILEPVRTVVSARVDVGDLPAAETVLARLLFNLGSFLAPEPRRVSLRGLLARGLAPDEIFEGPLLRHGFIEDGQLQPKAALIPVASLVRLVARTEGVQSVSGLKVRVGDDGHTYEGGTSIPVPADQVLGLDDGPDARGGFPLRLFRNGVELRPSASRVRRELDRLWAEQRRRYDLAAEYAQLLPFPRGRWRDLESYTSIQDQYPNVYGIGPAGLPAESSPPRRGQARQLKGYLLVFEQLLADFFAQLARAKDLYSLDASLDRTYFYQYLDRSVPDVRPLLEGHPAGAAEDGEERRPSGYWSGLPRIVATQDPFVERRNRFLDLLLALSAQRLDAADVADFGPGGGQEEDGPRLIRAKLELLRALVAATRDRGRGFDYLAPASPANVAGLAIKSRIQLGLGPGEEREKGDEPDRGEDEARGRGRLYVVEHTLLRYAQEQAGSGERGATRAPDPRTFVYSFTATAVVFAPAALRDDPGYRRFVSEVLGANAPAHVVLEVRFLGPAERARFEDRYWAWRRALRAGDEYERVVTSRRLQAFLEGCAAEAADGGAAGEE
jgi:hypothetical protein